jgi:anti-sigma B factor antagonist
VSAVRVVGSVASGIQVITLEGEIDGKTAPMAQQEIIPLLPAGAPVVLDLSAVGYMSSAGLRMMLLIYRQGMSKGSTIALAGLSEEIRDTMDATGFLGFFTVADTVEGALAALSGGS